MQHHAEAARYTPFPQLSAVIITRQLYRLLQSGTLARANYLTRLLKCCVEQTLAGNSGQLKELWLGTAVFNRKEGFDPRRDPIVRVQARRLREKLEYYYRTEGLLDDVRITMPTGSYVPVFSTIDLRRWAKVPTERPCAVAVLPFSHLDDDSESAIFADVITSELTHAMVEGGGLEVVSRTSSLSYKGVAADVRFIGKTLNADFIVEGSVRMDQEFHRITLQLTDCSTGYHCWAAWFEQRNTRIAPDAKRIAELLRQELSTGGLSQLAPRAMAAAARPN